MMKKPSCSSSSCSSSSATTSFRARATTGRGTTRKPARASPIVLSRCHVTNASSSSSSCSSSTSSTSVEAPRGCLRYFLPHSKTLTPKSTKLNLANVPDVRSGRNCDRRSAKAYAKRPDKDSSNNNDAKMKKNKEENVVGAAGISTPVQKVEKCCETDAGRIRKDVMMDVMMDDQENCCNNSSNGKAKTPPIEASVSPEIQSGSAAFNNSSAATPVGRPCYGAGHVLSGVVDKRKCRPRGILTVRDDGNDSNPKVRSDIFGSVDCVVDDVDNSGQSIEMTIISAVPLPSEASVRWLLSPLNEEEDDEQKKFSSVRGVEGSVSLPSPDASPSSGVPLFSSPDHGKCSKTISTSPSPYGRGSISRNFSLASPRCPVEIKQLLEPRSGDGGSFSPTDMTPIVRMVTSKEDEIPFTMDCLSDGNVILTPHSHSGSGPGLRRSWRENCDIRKDGNDAEMDFLTEVLHKATISPKHSSSPWDSMADLGLGGCIDLAKVQDVMDSKVSWISTTLENKSQSQLRISWRDGLSSRIFEMDEYDRCRCLSDDEEDDQVELKLNRSPTEHTLSREHLVDFQKDDANFRAVEFLHEKQETEHGKQQGEANCSPCEHCPSESISFSGEGLTSSGDSDWNFFYKNQLFRL